MADTAPARSHITTACTTPAPETDATLVAAVIETDGDLASLTARLTAGPATATPHNPAAASPRKTSHPPADDQHQGLSAASRAGFQRLQALEDAITYRRSRVGAPCPDCPPGGPWCDDHACDLMLIAAYQRTAYAARLDMSSLASGLRDDNPADRPDQNNASAGTVPPQPRGGGHE